MTKDAWTRVFGATVVVVGAGVLVVTFATWRATPTWTASRGAGAQVALDAGSDRESVLLADPLDEPRPYVPPAVPERDSGGRNSRDYDPLYRKMMKASGSASPEPSDGGLPNSDPTLGNRLKLTSFKDQLKRKSAAGEATDGDRRMLRALCRQLGDMSCAH